MRAVANCARYTVNALSAMSWPALAASCVVLALAMTIVPMALGLFIIFMAVKLVVGAASERAERGPATPYKPVEPVAPGSDKDSDSKGE